MSNETNQTDSVQGGPGQDPDARRKQLLSDAEAHRREKPSMDAIPFVAYGRTPLAGAAPLDYAQAGTMIQLGIHHWDESIPTGQKVRTELAAEMITQGVVETLIWLKAKGYDVPELITREELTRNLDFDPAQGHSVTGLANIGYALMDAIREHMGTYGWEKSPAEVVKTLVDERNSVYLGLVTANRVSIVSFLQWVASQPADTPPVDLATAVEKFLAQSPDAMLADEPEAQRDNAMVDAFAAHMKMRLAEKRATGKGGWHLPDSLEANIKGYVAHAAGGNLVDAANYLAMLKIGHGIAHTPTLKVDLVAGTVSADDSPVVAEGLDILDQGYRAHVEDQMRAGLSAMANDPVAWAVGRWNDEVKNRPLVNIHRRTLDDTWRQVIRHFGGDAELLLGPNHDTLHLQAQEDRAWQPDSPSAHADDAPHYEPGPDEGSAP
jgi:hypothetical protein